jgi:hypothetical protein
MKTLFALLRFPAAVAAFAALVARAPAADSHPAATRTADLQVVVDVPPTWRPFLEDDIAEALFYRLRDAFARGGYRGEMIQLDRTDGRNPNVPTLEVSLTEWRIDRIGNAQCTMTARLITPNGGEKSLGLASGTAMFWPNGPRWGFSRRLETADALEDAANDAARDVFQSVAKSGLLPGMPTRR